METIKVFLFLVFGSIFAQEEELAKKQSEDRHYEVVVKANTTNFWLQVAIEDADKGRIPNDFIMEQAKKALKESGKEVVEIKKVEDDLIALAKMNSTKVRTASAK